MQHDKNAMAQRLAESHFRVDSSIEHIFRLLATDEDEARQDEPIKLLEVTQGTPKCGIMPVHFTAHPPSGIFYPSVIVEVHSDEFDKIKQKKMPLPNGWKVSREYARPDLAASA